MRSCSEVSLFKDDHSVGVGAVSHQEPLHAVIMIDGVDGAGYGI